MLFQTPERDAWHKIRGDHVPQGASKVSMGDSLAAAHKALKTKDLDKSIAAMEKLHTACETYKKDIDKKYHGFVATFSEKVKKKVDFDLDKLNEVKHARDAYKEKYKHAMELWVAVTQKNEALTPFAHALRDIKKTVIEETAGILVAWDEAYNERALVAGDAAKQIYQGTITKANEAVKAMMQGLFEKLKPT